MKRLGKNNARVTAMALLLIAIAGFGGRCRADENETRNAPTRIESEVFVDKKLGAALPRLNFVDDAGATVSLAGALGGRPSVLALVYYECPSICGMLTSGLFRALRETGLNAGSDFNLVLVSIDPTEGPALAAAKKANLLKQYGRPGWEGGTRLLTGREDAIRALAASVGFSYRYDEKTKQYAHPAVAFSVTPDGRVSQYHAGVEFSSRDLRLALVEASGNKIGSPLDQFFLYCYRYDPHAGRYGLVIMRVLRLFGALTVLGIGAGVALLFIRERRRKATRGTVAS